jgi:hypothetical protein
MKDWLKHAEYLSHDHSFIKVRGRIPYRQHPKKLARFYKNFLFKSTTAISKQVFQEVDGTVIVPLIL